MTEAFSKWIIPLRWAIIAGALLIVLAAAGGASRLVFIDSYRVFFSKENPDLQTFEKVENVYTKNDNVLFLVAPKDGRVFTRETLSSIEWLTREAWKIPFSTRVDSVTNFQHTWARNDELVVQNLVENASNLSDADRERTRRIARAEPLLVNLIVAPRAHVTAVQPEYRYKWENGKQSFTITPFARLDQHDSERTHFDIRELTWLKAGEGWELRLGIRKVFWGVTESQHLVDIINQTDLVENLDGEDKLGQPMVNLALIRRWSTLDLFVFPGSRGRKVPARKGRLRTALPPLRVDNDRAVYESGRGRGHIDWAARWSRTFGEWDVGLSHFYGTSREPRLLPDVGGKALVPHYDLIHQTGLDAQWTKGKWLWKLEAIRRSGQGAGFTALTGGFEYTLSNFAGSRADVGLIAEYLYDQRGNNATTPFQDDIMA